MEHTVLNIGFGHLLRWYKSITWSAHRRRIDDEFLTGLRVSCEINVVANLLETVVDAVYLYRCSKPALHFTDLTLVYNASFVKRLIKCSAQMQNDYVQVITMIFRDPLFSIK